MKKKTSIFLLVAFLAAGLCLIPAGFAAASPDVIWQIGTQDGLNSEFGTSWTGQDSATYNVGDPLVNFPSGLYTADYGGRDLGVNQVTISFTTGVIYQNVSLAYYRMGGETNEVWFDGTSLGSCTGPEDPYPSTLYTFTIGTVETGNHTITIQCTGHGVGTGGIGEGDGWHTIDFLQLTGDPVVSVNVDIKPVSCPNPINVNSKGVLPVAILGNADFDVSQVDPVTILLEGVAPLRWSLEDVAGPECSGPDGYQDLTLKFSSQEIKDALGAVSDGDVLSLYLTGSLKEDFGSILISGDDEVVIIKKQ